MNDLKDLLLNTLKGVNEAFDAALADLQAIVHQVDAAVKSASPEIAVLLIPREKHPSGSTFELIVKGKNTFQRVGFYKVGAVGYPIVNSSSLAELRTGIGMSQRMLNDVADLKSEFASMMQDQNSSLVSAISYILRK